MIRRVVSLSVVAALTAIFYYVSRFWDFRLWDRDGLFSVEALRPQGGLVARWLRGTDFAPFELLLWLLGVFVILTLVQKLFDALTPKETDHD